MSGDVWGDALRRYTIELQAAGRASGTIRLHRYRLLDLAERHPDPWAVTSADLLEYLAHPEWKPETRKSVRTILRGFYGWAAGEGLIPADPAARLRPVRVPAGVPKPAPEDVVRAALEHEDPRTRLMVQLAAFGGLRAAEVARVHARDLVGDVLRVTGKGGKTREVPLSDPELLDTLRALDGWAFPNRWRPDEHVTPGTVSRLLSQVLPDGWTAHTLRHRMASQAYAGSRDLLSVGQLLGHSRPETTQRYVRLPDDALRAAIAHVETYQSARAHLRVVRDGMVPDTAVCPGWCAGHETIEPGTWRHVWRLVDTAELVICLSYFGEFEGEPGDGVVALEVLGPRQGAGMEFEATPDLLRGFAGVVGAADVLLP